MFTKLFGVSRRWEMILLLMSGIVIVYTLRVNASVAAPEMVDDLHWSDDQKGLLLSSFYWGYALGQLPASIYCKLYGARVLFGLSVVVPSLLSIFFPFAARQSLWFGLIVRMLIGFTESASFPCVFYFFQSWVPKDEKTMLVSTAYAGMYVGEIIGFSVSGYLVKSTIDANGVALGSWASVFYLFGACGILWAPLWFTFAYETPEDHPNISSEELNIFRLQSGYPTKDCVKTYSALGDSLMDNHHDVEVQVPLHAHGTIVATPANSSTPLVNRKAVASGSLDEVPWKAMFTDIRALNCYFNSWTYGLIGFMLLSEMPSYLSDILSFDIQTSGVLCIAPYLGMFICAIGFGKIFDYCQFKYYWKTRTVRQVAEFLAIGGSGLSLLICPFIDNRYIAYTLIVLSQAFLGIYNSGNACNYLEMSPKFSSIMNTIGNTIAAVAGIVGPLMVARCTASWPGILGWKIVFGITFGFCIVALLLWSKFQTSEVVEELNTPVSLKKENHQDSGLLK